MIDARHTLLLAAAVAWTMSCSGDDGKVGPPGPPGPPGPSGEAGDGSTDTGGTNGTGGTGGDGGAGGAFSLPEGTLHTSCLSPCHGFTGLVEQWKTSAHFATYVANLGGEEVATWTGATACGNCHASDGLEQRLNENVNYIGDNPPADLVHGQTNYVNSENDRVVESTYAGQTTVAMVGCTTCHAVTDENDPHMTGEPYEVGSFPLRVPSGDGDYSLIEKSSDVGVADGTSVGEYSVGNACIWCHKSRKDVTNYIGVSNDVTSQHWGPHLGPQADVYSGLGGYHYADVEYDSSSHQNFSRGCVTCHMAKDESNQEVGDHSFYPKLSTCQNSGCHASATSFDVGGEQTAITASLTELRAVLAPWLTRSEDEPFESLTPEQLEDSSQLQEDLAMPDTLGLTADEAGALYNYLLITRGGGRGVHNPLYIRQLIYDSYFALTDEAPASMPTRPAP